MKVVQDQVFAPVTVTLETMEELASVRDALFASNDLTAIKFAKALNALVQRRRGRQAKHTKNIDVTSIEDKLVAAIRDNPMKNLSELSTIVPSVSNKSISGTLTILHQKGRVIRLKSENGGGYKYKIKEVAE